MARFWTSMSGDVGTVASATATMLVGWLPSAGLPLPSLRVGPTPSAVAVAWLVNVSWLGLPSRFTSGDTTVTRKVAETNSPTLSDGIVTATDWPVTVIWLPLPVMVVCAGTVLVRPVGMVSVSATLVSVVVPVLEKISV